MATQGYEYGEWDPLWAEPADISRRKAPQILSAGQVQQWRELGVCVVHGLWPEDLIARASAECEAAWPVGAQDPNGRRFPYAEELHALNEVTLCPRYHAAVRQLLDEPDVLLTWSHCIAKHGSEAPGGGATGTLGAESFGTGAQPFHQDFGNNTLVVPPPDAPESVSCILYYSDVDECMGPTAFKLRAEHFGDNPAEPSWRVAKHGSVGAGPSDLLAPDELVETALDSRNFTTHRTAQQRPDIYADEQAVRYRPGTALLYRMDVWHRGTPVLPGATRYTHHMGIRRADAHHIQFEQTWAKDFWSMQHMKDFVASMETPQRSVLGFPAPGNRYWTVQTVAAVADRYTGIDMKDYKEALLARGSAAKL